MERKIDLGDGYTATVWWGAVDDRWVVTAAALYHEGVTLGVLWLDERGELTTPGYWEWFRSDEEQAAAEQYYRRRYPDLADADRQTLFEEGFTRECRRLRDALRRAGETARAMSQTDQEPYVAVDHEGRIVQYGETAEDLVGDLPDGVWASPDYADERTLMIAPIGRIRVQVA
jgi:hypothetical protein